MEIDELKNSVKDLDGWLFPNEAAFLYTSAKNCKGQGTIVEIGSWKGKSTVCLAKGSKLQSNSKVYAIDPHTGSPEHGQVWTFEEFKQNIKNAEVEDIVIPFVKTSEEVSKTFNDPVEFLFIDGLHEYEGVRLDFDLWYPKVLNEGIIAFHDLRGPFSGPRKVFRNQVCKSRKFKDFGLCETIGYARKVEKNSFKDILKGRYILLLTYSYDFGMVLYNFKPLRPFLNFAKKIVEKIQ